MDVLTKMAKRTQLTPQEAEWIEKYGSLPDDPDKLRELASIIKRVDEERYQSEKKRIEEMQWHTLNITLPLIPKCTPRPRYSSRNNAFYVKGAAENKKIIKKLIKYNRIISTMTYFKIEAYLPTPMSSMKGYEILLAEEGLIRPMITKDWDNLGKTYSDMVQDYLLLNDNIICDGEVEKYFSIRPRVEIHIKYQDDYDSDYNRRRIESSKSYKKLIDPQKTIKVILDKEE